MRHVVKRAVVSDGLEKRLHTILDLGGTLPSIMQYGRESRIPNRRVPPLRQLAPPRTRAELFSLGIDVDPLVQDEEVKEHVFTEFVSSLVLFRTITTANILVQAH